MAQTTSIRLLETLPWSFITQEKKILLDPMFFPKGAYDPLAGIARNPAVDLAERWRSPETRELLQVNGGYTAC